MPINKIKLNAIPDGEIAAVKFHQSGATDGQTLVWSTANGKWQPGAGGGGGSMSDLVDDTTPQLGGDLDGQAFNITTTGGINGATLTGTLQTASQTNITSVGALTGLQLTGVVNNNATLSPTLTIERSDPVPADFAKAGQIVFKGTNSASAQIEYASIEMNTDDVTDSTEDGRLRVNVIKDGTKTAIVDATSTSFQLRNSIPLNWQNAGGSGVHTSLQVITPTSSRTISLPDASGTVALTSDLGGPTSAYAKFIYEISSTVTSVSGADVNGNTLSYTSGNNVVEVFVNGVKQQEGTGKDYQATTGNSVVFASDLYSGDLVDVIAYNMFDANVLDINTVLVNQNLGGDPANDDGNLIISHGATGQPMASIEAGAVRNIAIGNQNLTSLTTGDNNVALGKTCLTGINTGSNNLAIGLGTLQYGNHSDNVCVGNLSNSNSSSASGHYRNTSIGQGANQYCTTGDYDTCLGAYARPYYQNTSYTTAIGYGSRSGYNHCTSVGTYAGASMYNQSDYTTLIGNYAGYDLDAGDRATFIGYRAGYSGGSGSYNTAVGVNSMYDITSGERNTAIGDSAGYNIESGDHNTLLGQAVGYDLTTGDQNTLLGHNAGNAGTNDLVSGSNNTIIGYLAGSTSSSMSNTVVLGNASITSLQCNVQSISALSDERDKTDIQDLTLGLDFIKAMRPVQFTWNRRDGTLGTKKEVGFIAQELQEVEMDFNSKNRTHMVDDDDPSKLLAAPMQSYPILIKAIQELSAKVDSLQAEVNTLKNGG